MEWTVYSSKTVNVCVVKLTTIKQIIEMLYFIMTIVFCEVSENIDNIWSMC